MRVKADAFGRTVRALATATQVDSQALLHVIVEIVVGLSGIAVTEVRALSVETSIQLGKQDRKRFEPVPATGKSPHGRPLLQQSLLRREHIQICRLTVPTPVIPKRVAQKIQAGSGMPKMNDPCLFPVQLQAHPSVSYTHLTLPTSDLV